LYRFRDIAGYLSKVADFDPPHLHSAPPVGGDPGRISRDLWHQKTRVPEVSFGVVCVILCLAVLVELQLVTDRHRQTQTQAQDRAKNTMRRQVNEHVYSPVHGRKIREYIKPNAIIQTGAMPTRLQ